MNSKCEICQQSMEDRELSEMADFQRVCIKCFDENQITLKNVIGGWSKLGHICINEDEQIEDDFSFAGRFYPKGTDQYEIWHDFDRILSEKFNTCLGKFMCENT